MERAPGFLRKMPEMRFRVAVVLRKKAATAFSVSLACRLAHGRSRSDAKPHVSRSNREPDTLALPPNSATSDLLMLRNFGRLVLRGIETDRAMSKYFFATSFEIYKFSTASSFFLLGE